MKRMGIVLVILVAVMVLMRVQQDRVTGRHGHHGQEAASQQPPAPPKMPPLMTPEIVKTEGDWVITKSGLKFMDVKVGKGAQPKTSGDTIAVHYTGKLENGKVFDTSMKHPDANPAQFPIGQLIQGWQEGLSTMKEGGKRKLIVPPHLGYGESGSGENIPPNATLTFDVELVKVQAAPVGPPMPPMPPKGGAPDHDHDNCQDHDH